MRVGSWGILLAVAASWTVDAAADPTTKPPETKVVVLDDVAAPAHAANGGDLRLPAKGWRAQITVPKSATVEMKDNDGDAFISVHADSFKLVVEQHHDLDAAERTYKAAKLTVKRDVTPDAITLIAGSKDNQLLNHVFVQRKSLKLVCWASFHDWSVEDAALATCKSLAAH